MVKRYRVTLTEKERQDLEALTRKRTAPVRTVRRAQTLLLAADDKTDEVIAERLRMGVAALERLRRRFVEEGLQRRCRGGPGRVRGRSWGRRSRRSWSPWPAPGRRRGGTAGRRSSWPTG
jgi:hypothetical protein